MLLPYFLCYFAVPIMKFKYLLYNVALLFLLSSCSQWKSLTARDNSAVSKPVAKRQQKEPKFLDISVSPGQVVTTKHPMRNTTPSAEKRKKEREVYNASVKSVSNAGDIEKADWLQLKYAIVLDATVETLTNVSLLKLIDDWFGTDYCIGGLTKNCIDCSGFSSVIMQEVFKVTVPRTAQEQFNESQKINVEDLTEGDLVFFYTGGRDISHVGVYLQNNKFVHASSSGGVMVSDLNDNYWKGRFKGAGRYLEANTAALLNGANK